MKVQRMMLDIAEARTNARIFAEADHVSMEGEGTDSDSDSEFTVTAASAAASAWLQAMAQKIASSSARRQIERLGMSGDVPARGATHSAKHTLI